MVSPLGAPAFNKISRLVCPAGAYCTIGCIDEFSGLSSIATALLSGPYLAIAAADTILTATLNNKGHGRRQTSVANLVKCGSRQRPSDRTSTNVQYTPASSYVNPLA
jgi:hypothetical protein